MRIACFVFAAGALCAAPGGTLVGSKVCASCHAEIAKKYSLTGMARTSSPVGEASFRETFNEVVDTGSGARYTISPQYKLTFEHPSTKSSGSFDLKWSIGSGAVGRSYMGWIDGFLFQSPVSYYSSASRWDISPGFGGRPNVDMARPIEEACLQCHATGPRAMAGTQNKYPDPPFLEAGVGCERCHGPGGKHVESIRSAATNKAIVNPAKLDPARRDSVCLQCHLTGAAKVARAGKSAFAYTPGDLLSDYVAVFVWQGGSRELQAATDHAEQLSRSKCAQASSGRLWCGSCHDSHSEPNTNERAAFYRKACLACHQQPDCKESPAKRTQVQDDCRACHMPKSRSREGEHVAFTQHSIPRRPTSASAGTRELKSFFAGQSNTRDLALAYASLAAENKASSARAASLLEASVRALPEDAVVLGQLAQVYDSAGKAKDAEELYRRVLRIDPMHPTASANLGIYAAQAGKLDEAKRLWQDVFNRYPALVGPGMNLALAQYNSGEKAAAEATLLRVVRFHPDFPAARDFLARVRSSGR